MVLPIGPRAPAQYGKLMSLEIVIAEVERPSAVKVPGIMQIE
jgi:hypothetical protein